MVHLVKAREELEEARVALEQMKGSHSLPELERAWKEFLRRLERVWYKTTHQLEGNSRYNGWVTRGRTEKLRKKDPLLSYLKNARGAEEHTVSDIVGQEPGGIGINPAFGNSLYIRHMTINNGEIFIDSPQLIKVEFIPGKIRLLPVINRGVQYQPPASHLGNSVAGCGPLEIAEAGLAFYKSYVEAAEHFLRK